MQEKPDIAGIVRFYARTKAEHARLVELGAKPARIYLEGRGGETLSKINMRDGETLGAVHGLRPLGDSRKEIIANLARLHNMGAFVVDVETGDRSGPGEGAFMLHAALARIHGEVSGPTPERAKRMQAAGVKERTAGRMGKRDARKIWHGNKALSNAEVLDLMPGWAERTAYLLFGKRKRPTGRGKKV